MIPLLLLLSLGGLVLAAVIIGITAHDISVIKTERAIRKHPNARRLRKRPVVYVVIKGTPTEECLRSIRKSRYRKIIIVGDNSIPTDGLVLQIDNDTILEPSAIIDAVQHFNNDPSLRSIGIAPILQMTDSTKQFLRNYYKIANHPFDIIRTVFGVSSRTNTLYRQNRLRKSRSVRAYISVSWLAKVLNFSLFVYTLSAAALYEQPQLLLIYILSLTFWLTWTIGRYPHLAIHEKASYIFLSPASFIYFACRTLTAPFRLERRQSTPQSAIIKT